MSQSANVTSIDSIKDFRASLCRFAEDTKNALGAMEMEIRRTSEWLLHDRPMYWQNEIKRRKESLSMAQSELFRRRLQAGPGREVKDTEQKEAVRIAQRRLVEAEDKLERVKKWAPVFQHAVSEYQARARPTGDMLESDVRLALELLDRMTNALDAYVTMAPPTSSGIDASVGSTAGTTPIASTTPPAAANSSSPEPAPAGETEAESASGEGPPQPVG
jgi:hypothetical protein